MANIVLFDIETTPLKLYAWDVYNGTSHKGIIDDWSIICGAWKVLGEDKVYATQVSEVGNDLDVCITLRDALAHADIIVGHNSDKFDIKKLNTRLVYYGLEPLPLIPTVDTLKEAKKMFKFSSNRLDYISKFLTGKGKIHVEYELWLEVMEGNKKSLKKMVDYNKEDVRVLEGVYEYLRPFMKNHPHVGAIEGLDRTCSCPKCGSERMKRNGIRVTATGIKKQELQCQNCGGYTRVVFKEV